MRRKETMTLKDIIYRMFLKYAVAPAFLLAFAGVMITFGIWEFSTLDSAKSASDTISTEFQNVIMGYEEALITLVADNTILENPFDKDIQVSIFEDVYKLSNTLGYKAKIYILNKDHEPILASTKELPPALSDSSLANWGIFREMNQNTGDTAYHVVQNTDNQCANLYIGRAMMKNGEVAGYVVFDIDSAEFRFLLTKVPFQTIITDSYGWIYLTNNYDFSDNLNRMSRQYEEQKGYINCNEKSFYKINTDVLNKQFKVYTVCDISNQLTGFKWMGLLLTLIFIIILFSMIYGANRISVNSTKDIDLIEKAFVQVQEGNLNSYISINSSKEFENISNAYNAMLDSLKEQIEKNKEMIAHMAFAQIKQLESQINPHFLFNTLENIRVMCKMDTAKADKMIVNLASLLRYSISNAEEDVTVRQDLQTMKHYLDIVKIRFNSRFQYKIEIDEEVMDCVIPKLLIQPLIENAIKYGFKDKEVLIVSIRGYMEAGCLKFICKDDGSGISEETLKELKYTLTQPKNRTSHLGLYNIHKRINLKYKGDYGVKIESKANEGTTLILTLPICKNKGMSQKE